ncbi:uncharacterized protein [Montipora capricornis]|uniref:uncharacterized protein n=1 Tax=Montipora capricornis TaxID=246305 RepID=UPI0035F135CB
MDEGLYNKAKMLQWEKMEEFKNLIIVLGGFHTQMTFTKVIGKLQRKKQLWEYLFSNEELQSAYKANHSCETVLIRVQDDILEATDSHRGVLLLSLDVSADHEILLGRRSSRFGIKGKALDWLQSHLTNRTQYVKVDDASSTVRPLYWGVR